MGIVNWSTLAEALEFYPLHGYRRIELPWFQPPTIIAETCPNPDAIIMAGDFGGLVGSAEQSFMAADFDGAIGTGKFVSLTPCFRNEPVVDELHLVTFMKVELYNNEDTKPGAVFEMIRLAQRFMSIATGYEPNVVETADGFDLEIGGVEVGSYGVRTRRGKMWVYGTGVAEPRLSTAATMLAERHSSL